MTVEGTRAELSGSGHRTIEIGIGEADQIGILELFEHAQMPVGDAADADEADACPAHAVMPCAIRVFSNAS